MFKFWSEIREEEKSHIGIAHIYGCLKFPKKQYIVIIIFQSWVPEVIVLYNEE